MSYVTLRGFTFGAVLVGWSGYLEISSWWAMSVGLPPPPPPQAPTRAGRSTT